jgi:hypothetical protein
MQATSTLFVKVAVKQRPYSKEAVAISVTASFNPNFNYNTALHYKTLALETVNLALIDHTVNQLQSITNAEETFVKYSPAVIKYLK